MKRIFAAAAVMVFLISTAAFAGVNDVFTTNARLDGLQLQNWQTEDDYVIWFNPGRIVNYKDRVYGELGTWVGGGIGMNNDEIDKWGGANYNTSFGTWGAYIGRPYPGYPVLPGMPVPAVPVTHINKMADSVGGTGGTFPTTMDPSGAFTALAATFPGAAGWSWLPGTASNPAIVDPDNKIDLFWGKELRSVNIGARVSLALYSKDNDLKNGANLNTTGFPAWTGKDNLDTSDITVALGAQFKGLPLDIAVIFGMPSLTWENSRDYTAAAGASAETIKASIESDGTNNIGILARLISGAGRNANLFTTLRVGIINDSSVAKFDFNNPAAQRVYSEKRTRDDKTTAFGIDTALNARPGADTLFVGTVGLTYAAEKAELKAERVTDETAGVIQTFEGIIQASKEDTTVLSIPLTIGIEHQTFKAVKTRFSVSKPIYQSISTVTTDDTYGAGVPATTRVKTAENKVDNFFMGKTPVSVALGLGAELGKNLSLDATMNEDVLFTGTWLISGIENTLFGKISATYKF